MRKCKSKNALAVFATAGIIAAVIISMGACSNPEGEETGPSPSVAQALLKVTLSNDESWIGGSNVTAEAEADAVWTIEPNVAASFVGDAKKRTLKVDATSATATAVNNSTAAYAEFTITAKAGAAVGTQKVKIYKSKPTHTFVVTVTEKDGKTTTDKNSKLNFSAKITKEGTETPYESVTWSCAPAAAGAAIDAAGVLTVPATAKYGDVITVTATLKSNNAIKGEADVTVTNPAAAQLGKTANPWWVGGGNPTNAIAHWNLVSGVPAAKYTVNLYKEGSRVHSVNGGTAYTDNGEKAYVDFTAKVDALGAGKYTFGVITKGDGSTTRDSEESVCATEYKFDKDLPQAGNLRWDGETARWNSVDHASGYEVQLYKGGTALGAKVTKTAAETSHDFTTVITANGTYSFKVRAKGAGQAGTGVWKDSPEAASPDRTVNNRDNGIVITTTDTTDTTDIARNEITRGGNKTFTASPAGVTWSVTGKNATGGAVTPLKPGTAIDASGKLTVAADEEAVWLTVKAAKGTESATKDVFVNKYGDVFAIGNGFAGNWDAATSGTKMHYEGTGVYTIGTIGANPLLLSKGGTFKFHGAVTAWDSGTWFNPTVNEEAPADEKAVTVESTSGNNAFKVTQGGKYTISLNTVTGKVTFTATHQPAITITGTPSALILGETWTFTATAVPADLPALTWKVYGDNTGTAPNVHDAAKVAANGTTISAAGVLTVGANEWITHSLYIAAESSLGEVSPTIGPIHIIDEEVYIVGLESSWNIGNSKSMTRGTTAATNHQFTWTGTNLPLNDDNSKKFRMWYKETSASGSSTWQSGKWLTADHTGSDAYGINSGHHGNMAVARWGNAGESSAAKDNWTISWDAGASYTFIYDAAAKKLAVNKN